MTVIKPATLWSQDYAVGLVFEICISEAVIFLVEPLRNLVQKEGLFFGS